MEFHCYYWEKLNLKYAQVTKRFRAQNNFRMVARHDDRPKKFLLG